MYIFSTYHLKLFFENAAHAPATTSSSTVPAATLTSGLTTTSVLTTTMTTTGAVTTTMTPAEQAKFANPTATVSEYSKTEETHSKVFKLIGTNYTPPNTNLVALIIVLSDIECAIICKIRLSCVSFSTNVVDSAKIECRMYRTTGSYSEVQNGFKHFQ